VGGSDHGVHERGAATSPLLRRIDTARAEAHDAPRLEPPARADDVTDHVPVGILGHERERPDVAVVLAQLTHQPDLGGVRAQGRVPERAAVHGVDAVVVRDGLLSDQHAKPRRLRPRPPVRRPRQTRKDVTMSTDPMAWPALPVAAWEDTRDTLHLYTQVVGKVRLANEP